MLRKRLQLHSIVSTAENSEEARDLRQMVHAESAFGFLFIRYEQEWFWWEIVVMGRKLLFMLIATFIRSPLEQLRARDDRP